MTVIRTEGAMPGLDDATTTAEKRISRWNSQVNWENLGKRKQRRIVDSGIDTAALSKKYGMEAATRPQLIEATFKVPFGVSKPRYLEYRKAALKRLIENMDKMGYEFRPEMGIVVEKGMYPVIDLRDRRPDWEHREMRILAYFRFRKPEPVTIEVPKHLLEDRVVSG